MKLKRKIDLFSNKTLKEASVVNVNRKDTGYQELQLKTGKQ